MEIEKEPQTGVATSRFKVRGDSTPHDLLVEKAFKLAAYIYDRYPDATIHGTDFDPLVGGDKIYAKLRVEFEEGDS